MRRMLLIECMQKGVLFVNGQFCGPMEEEGQAFPCGINEEIYIQLFPFGEGVPLTAKMILKNGSVEMLEPEGNCYALLWPDGVVQLELRVQGQAQAPMQEKKVTSNVLLRYLDMQLAGDAQANLLLMQQNIRNLPDLSGYHAVVPLRFAFENTDGQFDMQAGLVRRVAPNIACVDAALAMTVPIGQGRRLIERIEIMRI